MIPISVKRRISFFALVLGPLTTLVVTPWFNFDPINLGKNFTLTSISFAGFGLLIPYLNILHEQLGRAIIVISTCFIAFLLIPLLLTQAPFSQQFWGQFGRGTGILTYISLLFALLMVACLSNPKDHRRILNGLLVTQVTMTIYCLFQITGNDPIGWSSFSTFGTLGNVNFLSGFMGVSVVVSLINSFSKEFSLISRLLLFLLSLLDIYIVATTDSIQGLVALAVGISAYFLFLLLKLRQRVLLSAYLIMLLSGLVGLIFSLFDKGPLRSLIYQVTIIYRADYMHAAWKMLQENPLTGVGIDSYDDWYRTERGVISAFRTGLNRTANTAHNIVLDLGSGGGFPLMFSYLALIAIISISIYRGMKNGGLNDTLFTALSCAWIAYQVQASVSINQIGVGVWGWVLSGSIIGYSRYLSSRKEVNVEKELNHKKIKESTNGRKKNAPNTPPPIPVLLSFIAFSIGSTLTFLPLKADMDFRASYSKRDIDGIIKSTSGPAVNSFLMSQALNAAISNNLADQSRTLSDRLVTKYPRNFYGWNVRFTLTGISEVERRYALEQIRLIDPNSAICYNSDPVTLIKQKLGALPESKQRELVRGWNLPSGLPTAQNSFSMDRDIPKLELEAKLKTFC